MFNLNFASLTGAAKLTSDRICIAHREEPRHRSMLIYSRRLISHGATAFHMTDSVPFKNRRDAGVKLAEALAYLQAEHPLVLALPRGGVPVAYEVAMALNAPLDVLLVRKIGAPSFPELGLGAVVDGQPPRQILNEELIRAFNPSELYVEAETRRQITEIERRRQLYCGGRKPAKLTGRSVILVDDGIATGGTIKAALAGLSQTGIERVVLAVPVAPGDVVDGLRGLADDAVCLLTPEHFRAVSLYYEDFEQTGDEEVIALLDAAAQRAAAGDKNASSSVRTAPGKLGHRPFTNGL